MDTAMYAYQRMNLAAPQAAAAAASFVPDAGDPTDQQQQPDDDQVLQSFFCKAMYDYQSADASSLCFRKGDIIEVLTRLDSGWWDGLLGDERGWFPSNYVTVITEQEAEALFSGSSYDVPQSTLPDESVVDMSDSMSRALSESDREGDWLDRDADVSTPSQAGGAMSDVEDANGVQHHDFWVPQVGADGRIFYVNTQTGQVSQDLPQEADDEVEHDPLHGIRPPSGSRPGINTPNGLPQQAGFGVQRRSGTPEPWVRRLADDGLRYYYFNKLDGSQSWTLPSAQASGAPNGDDRMQRGMPPPGPSASNGPRPQASRMRSDSAASLGRERGYGAADRMSVYSDDSDVQPPLHRSRSDSSIGAVKPANGAHIAEPSIETIPEQTVLDLTPAEQVADALQQSLAPPPMESPLDMASTVREAIAAVVEFLQTSSPRRPDHGREVSARVLAVVTAVRNLLYVTATPSGHIPSHLYPRQSMDARAVPPPQGLQAYLKAAHRKVAGTLSKLVLSALAMQYDPTLSTTDKPNRMESDAAELERSVVAFIGELQRYQQEHPATPGDIKRLQAVFLPDYLGAGIPGAGVAGHWKGFGFTNPPERQRPASLALEPNQLAELRDIARTTQTLLDALRSSSQRTGYSQERVQSAGCFVIAYLSSFLSTACDINIAQHVDLDASRVAGSSNSAAHMQYVHSIEKGRAQLRTLEATCQALYDDSVTLMGSIQHLDLASETTKELTLRIAQWDSLGSTITANIGWVLETLDALFAVSMEQAALEKSAYMSSGAAPEEWQQQQHLQQPRPRQVSNATHSDPGREVERGPALYEEEEDVVDMELAFSRQSVRNASHSLSKASSHGPSLYANGAQHQSDTSLNTSDRSRSDGVGEPVTPTWPPHEAGDSGTLVASVDGDDDTVDTIDPEDETSPLFDDESPSSNAKPTPKATKIFKLLGSEAPQHYINQANVDQQPWYLRPNYDQAEILIDPDGGVRAGSKPALIERLTAHETADPTFAKNFMITFKSFMTLDELFELLVQRFWIQAPESLTPQELEDWTKQKQVMIRLRVLNTFRTMVTDEDVLEKDDMYILDNIREFASNPEVSSSTAAAKQLVILIDRVKKSGESLKTAITSSSAPPPPILPKTSKKLKLLDIDPTELARQLTLMESSMYKKIRPIECLQRSREQKVGKNNDNIASIIQLSNRIANWVADCVLSKEDSRKRAAVMKHFILVADRCRLMQNFSTMVAITSGLNTPPIRRLKRTWEQVNARFSTQLSGCEATIDSNKNFNNYRSTLARITPPCVPFIGTYLTTLTFINDGAEDKVAGHMINFRKRQKAAEVIQDIKRWQAMPYNFTVVAQILAFLEESFSKYQDGVDYGDQFWHLSLEREPREREDEKMARLLQESGFL